MKKLLVYLIVLISLTASNAQSAQQTVNAIIGDESFLSVFHSQPDASTNELLRIQTHLAYVEQKLRTADVAHLTKQQKENRQKVLDLLHEYSLSAVFPTNQDYPGERKPCFIDRNGAICAVGYLIAKTVGLEAAESINQKHQYEYLLDMKEEAITDWANEYGLSLEECALIQPTYGSMPTDRTSNVPIKTAYGVSSSLIGGASIGLSIINFSNGSKLTSRLGLLTGATQIVLGLASIRKDEILFPVNSYSERISYKGQRTLSYANITAGAATLVSSAFNSYLRRKNANARTAVNLYSYQNVNQQMNLGLLFVRSL